MMQGSRSFINLNSPPRYDADTDDAADVAEVTTRLPIICVSPGFYFLYIFII